MSNHPIPRPKTRTKDEDPDAAVDAGYALAFLVRLYDGPAEVFLLAEFEGPIPELRRPIVLLVDYVNHKIEQLVIEENVIASEEDWRLAPSAGKRGRLRFRLSAWSNRASGEEGRAIAFQN